MSVTQLEPSDLVAIPGGKFLMGQDDGRDEERPVHRVTVAPFRLCRYQVTNATEFAAATAADSAFCIAIRRSPWSA